MTEDENQESGNEGTDLAVPTSDSPRPALETCSTCLENFQSAYQATCEVTRLRAELATACRHGQSLSEEVDRLRAMIREANRMGFEILEEINGGRATAH